MCELYSYCSYKGSPVGFRIGKTKVENEIDLTLCDDNINQFVRKSFESGMITCVFGKLPKSDKYVYLVKKLEYTGNNGESIIYMNFAWIFSDYGKYISFASGIKTLSDDKISEIMYKIIKPDSNDEKFALKINGKELVNAIKNISGEDVMNERDRWSQDSLCVKVVSKSIDEKRINELYNGLYEEKFAFIKHKNSDYDYELKKKNYINKDKNIVGSLVAVLVGAGLDLPAIIHIPLTLLCAAIAGALWGGIAGWLLFCESSYLGSAFETR